MSVAGPGEEWMQDTFGADTEAAQTFLTSFQKSIESLTYDSLVSDDDDVNPILLALGGDREKYESFKEKLMQIEDEQILIQGLEQPILKETKETINELQTGGRKFKEILDGIISAPKSAKIREAAELAEGKALTKQHILDIGQENLEKDEFGGLTPEEIEALKSVIPELGRLGSFNFRIPFDQLLFDPGNYRLAKDTTVEALEESDEKLVDLVSIEQIIKSQDQIKNILYNADDVHKILPLKNSILHKGFQKEFPLGVVCTHEGEIRKKDEEGKFTDPLELNEDIVNYHFVIADGNRRATALRLLINDIQSIKLPKQKERVEDLIEKGIPCVIHLARNSAEGDAIRKEIQTNHHRLGQQPWSAFGDAYNLIKRFDEQTRLGFNETYVYKLLGSEFGIPANDLRMELRALRFLDKAVEKEIISEDMREQKFGLTKSYILKRWVNAFFKFNKPDLDFWPPEENEPEYLTFITYALTDDSVQQSKTTKAGDITFSQIKQAFNTDEEKVRKLLMDEDITSEGLLAISNKAANKETAESMSMLDWLKNVKLKLKAEKWTEDMDLIGGWNASSEKIQLGQSKLEMENLSKKFDKLWEDLTEDDNSLYVAWVDSLSDGSEAKKILSGIVGLMPLDGFISYVNGNHPDLIPSMNGYLQSNTEETDLEIGSDEGQEPPSQEKGSEAPAPPKKNEE